MRKGLNLHLYPSNFSNESRIEKQAQSIVERKIFEEVHLVGCNQEGLPSVRALSESISVRLLGINNKLGSSNISKLYIFCVWYLSVLWSYRKSKIICINAHSLSTLPLAYFLKKIHGAKLVYDTHELETETHSLSGVRKKISKILEAKLIPCVDNVSVVSESIADWYEKEYQIPRPVVVMNAPRLVDLKSSNYFREKFGIAGSSKIFLYQGMLSHGRGVESLISTFAFRLDATAVIIFMGYGPLQATVVKAADESDNIYYHLAVTPEDLLQYTASADVGVSLIENSCMSYYLSMPNKLFEYAMVGLPVLVSDMKEMSAFVSRNHMGEIVDASSINSINRAVDLLCGNEIHLYKVNAKKAAVENSWEIQEEKMMKIYQSLI